ncbi:MAG: hypothetical protein JWM64_233 [Frankiales bacterium]|nr:hypothetical protein [Frankiales bacterium]
MARVTPEERAQRDADEREAWLEEQLAAAPPYTQEQIDAHYRLLLPPQRYAGPRA